MSKSVDLVSAIEDGSTLSLADVGLHEDELVVAIGCRKLVLAVSNVMTLEQAAMALRTLHDRIVADLVDVPVDAHLDDVGE